MSVDIDYTVNKACESATVVILGEGIKHTTPAELFVLIDDKNLSNLT